MKNSKRFLHLSLSFFLISLGVMLLSFSAYRPARAAGLQHVGENWKVIGWRDVGIFIGGVPAGWISVGPYKWQIDGAVKELLPGNKLGDTLVDYGETYIAGTNDPDLIDDPAGWKNVEPNFSDFCDCPAGGNFGYFNNPTIAGAGNSIVVDLFGLTMANSSPFEFKTSGPYSFVVYGNLTYSNRMNTLGKAVVATGTSYPTKWRVNGWIDIKSNPS